MSTMNQTQEMGLRAADDIRSEGMRGEIVLPNDAGYDSARQLFNIAVDSRPALFARCRDSHDIEIAIRAARRNSLPVSVRGGGHDWAGRALRSNGLVIDLSGMRRVIVDVKSKTASIEGGATCGDVASAAAAFGLVAVTAAVASVGFAGLTLGGGYGPLSPKYGLAIDNLLGAEIVLADGRLVTANASENPDLFWALRGGGGNFGVVASLRVQLHSLETVIAGVIVFPEHEFEKALHGYAEMVMSTPDELTTIPGLHSGPDGAPMMAIATIWCGEEARGRRELAQLEPLAKPSLIQLTPMACPEMLDMFEAGFGSGYGSTVQTRSLSRLTPDAVTAIVAATRSRTSPLSKILWHHSHGAPTRVPAAQTPFGARQEHFMIDIIASWDRESLDNTIHRQWARDLSQALAPMAMKGGYPNMMGPDASDQIPYAYGDNLTRLQDIKRNFDADRVFTSATALPLNGPA